MAPNPGVRRAYTTRLPTRFAPIFTSHLRIIMNLPNKTPTPIHRLMLLSAALLAYANGAFAAHIVDDAQTHARALLSGTLGARHSAVDNQITPPTDGHQISTVDVQEQMRRLLLGAPNLAQTISPPRSANSTRSTKSAVSAEDSSARRMILGIRG